MISSEMLKNDAAHWNTQGLNARQDERAAEAEKDTRGGETTEDSLCFPFHPGSDDPSWGIVGAQKD